MKFITIAYWHAYDQNDTNLKHNTKLPYTKEKQNEIIDTFLKHKYNVMLQRVTDGLIIWADKGKFRQS